MPPPIIKIKFENKCYNCGKRYRSKHSCYSPRRKTKKPPEQSLEISPCLPVFPYDGLAKHLLERSNNESLALSAREKAVDLANEVVQDCDLQLKAKITYRHSVLMRLKGDVKGSQQIIQAFLSSIDSRSIGLTPEDQASLHISQANNHAYHLDFQEAHKEVRRCALVCLWNGVLCIGRLMRGEGNFQEAKTCFETCQRSPDLPKSKLLLVISGLADIYCELDGTTGDSSYLSKAEALVAPEIEKLRQSFVPSRGFRRLLLSLLEIEIKRGNHGAASSLVSELFGMYNGMQEPDIVDRLGHIRTLIAFARLSPTNEEAISRWNSVLTWGHLYNPLDGDVFLCGVVYLFLCLAWYQLGDINSSWASFQSALEVIRTKRRQYFIPGVGTYVFYQILDQVRSTIDWADPCIDTSLSRE